MRSSPTARVLPTTVMVVELLAGQGMAAPSHSAEAPNRLLQFNGHPLAIHECASVGTGCRESLPRTLTVVARQSSDPANGAVPQVSLEADASPSSKPEGRPPYPVIFIHGLASNADEAWGAFRDFLTNNGWTFGGRPEVVSNAGVVGFVSQPADFYTMNMSDWNVIGDLRCVFAECWFARFPSQSLSLEQQGLQVAAVVERVRAVNKSTKMILVGHSMGGLAARAYLQSLGSNRYANDVFALITVGTPHLGSPLADLLKEMSSAVTGPLGMAIPIDENSLAVRELQLSSPTLNALNAPNATSALPADVRYVTIGATGDIGVRLQTILGGAGDGIVSFDSQTFLPGRARDASRRTFDVLHPAPPGPILTLTPCFRAMAAAVTVVAELHRCETQDRGIWAELLRHLRSPSLSWQVPPPASIITGQSYRVTWTIAGGTSVTHANVHWDVVDPKDGVRCNERTDPPCSTLSAARDLPAGPFEASFVAPVATEPTQLQVVAHAIVDGVTVWSPTATATLWPAGSATSLPAPVNLGAPDQVIAEACCSDERWLSRSQTTGYSSYPRAFGASKASLQQVTTIPKGVWVRSVAGIAVGQRHTGRVTTQSGVSSIPQLRPGDLLDIYTYEGHGCYRAWYGGSFTILCDVDPVDSDAPPKEWWLEVVDTSGQRSWVAANEWRFVSAWGLNSELGASFAESTGPLEAKLRKAEQLIREGAELNGEVGKHGTTSVQGIIWSLDAELLRAMVRRGLDLSRHCPAFSATQITFRPGGIAMLRALLENGMQCGCLSQPALIEFLGYHNYNDGASVETAIEVARLLVAHGAKVSQRGIQGKTVLDLLGDPERGTGATRVRQALITMDAVQ